MLEILTRQLANAKNLSTEQIRQAVAQLADEKISPPIKADFLSALAQKGESPEEIAGFAAALREKSIQPPLDQNRMVCRCYRCLRCHWQPSIWLDHGYV